MIRMKFIMELPEDVLTIHKIFKAEGFQLFVVGGAVRDALSWETPKDFDLATDARPDDVKRMLDPVFKMLPLGEAFGIWQAFTPTGEFEIATFREDIGVGRRPDEVKFTTIEGDVKRRDLTINALFFDIDTKEVVDLVGGIEDLKNGIVRAVGNPTDRFNEDKIRILRAIRFATRFGCDLDDEIKKAIKLDNTPISGDGKRLSNERIRDEFLKMFKSAKDLKVMVDMLKEFDLLEWIFADLKTSEFDFNLMTDPLVFMAAFLKDNEVKDIRKVLNKQTFHNDEVATIAFLVSLQTLSIDTVVQLKKGQFKEVEGVKIPMATNVEIMDFTAALSLDSDEMLGFLDFKLTVTGEDAIAAGIAKGPEMGKFIKKEEEKFFNRLMMERLERP